MLIGLVPTERKREDYRLHIKNKRDYDIAVASGIAWGAYENLPLSWKEAEEEIRKFNEEGADVDLHNHTS